MQVRGPSITMTGLHPQTWTRKRNNWKLFTEVVCAPLTALYGTEFDPWRWDEGDRTYIYTPNPTWEAAVLESNRRHKLYAQCVPPSKWGITTRNP